MEQVAGTCATGLLLVVMLAGCGDSSMSIRVVFPDEQALKQTGQLELVAVEDPGGSGCSKILGRRPAQVAGAVAEQVITVPSVKQGLVFPDLPMDRLALGAVALDASSKITHAGCTPVRAEPGDTVEVVLTLIPCPAGACTGCTGVADCPAGLSCESNVCRCVENGACQGCCEGNACYPGTSTSRCGKVGGTCQACPTDPCASSSCVAGSCQVNPRPDGLSCAGGVCRGGQCCSGCWDGGACQTGTTETACGTRGAACQDCTNVQPCKKGMCLIGQCLGMSNLPDGSSCPGGTCESGVCCTGCWDGALCRPGTSLTQCGTGGELCAACNPPVTACQTASCASGTCQVINKNDGAYCTSGSCQQGVCCTGCWDATSQVCRPGNTADYCGTGGGACADCTLAPGVTCKNGSCE